MTAQDGDYERAMAAQAEAARQADEANRERVHGEIIRDLSGCLIGEFWCAGKLCIYDEDENEFQWDDIVGAIAAGRVRHLHIKY